MTLDQKRERIRELHQQMEEPRKEILRLRMEIAHEACPFKKGQRCQLGVSTCEVLSIHMGRWHDEDWIIHAGVVTQSGAVGDRSINLTPSDLPDMKPVEATI